ncbi:WbqC family protein [Anabaena sphaerica FACHB-251]|uniref:WbqC family protein n=1 Tax=Anabaena sphaerica FACHB-251 TaxID=2692883 RepID=A0A926ZYZ3_9NOST|nr:WbqC family protein [Anabaena sphaerica]MBD2292144.1 WbqC family protein [Anabaena sphaerica FACHB-251]
MKKVAILQSNYIPWKGYFDIINSVDEFILFDDMQYTKGDWRNRNKIKTSQGLIWLTIPVKVKGKCFQLIKDTQISNKTWIQKHWNSIIYNYARATYFRQYKEIFEDLYLNCEETFLSQVNYRFLVNICKILNINTKISWSMDYFIVEGKTERLVSICKQAGATEYLSGPAAKIYMDEELFKQENIKLSYFDYSNYPEYNQLFPSFEHGVSIIDLIFNEGVNAKKYMKTFK